MSSNVHTVRKIHGREFIYGWIDKSTAMSVKSFSHRAKIRRPMFQALALRQSRVVNGAISIKKEKLHHRCKRSSRTIREETVRKLISIMYFPGGESFYM